MFFTIHYVMLRGFYALEQTRTVFLIQCVIAVVNVTAALLLVREATAAQTSPALVVAYGTAYLAGAVGLLDGPGAPAARLRPASGGSWRASRGGWSVVALLAAAAAYAVGLLLREVFGPDPGVGLALLRAVAVTGVDVVAFVLLARLVRLREVTAVLDLVARRGSSRERAGGDLR